VIEKPGRKVLAELEPIVARELDASFVSRISPAEAKTIADALERARGTACSGVEAAAELEEREAA
jgi:hypothetical protein